MIFSTMQQDTAELLQQIKQLPFNIELANGTLKQDIFIFYLQQDMLYLQDFSRALAMTAARLPNSELLQQYLQFALGAVTAEHALHLNYLQGYRIKNNSIDPTPACFAYTNYLLKLASTGSIEESAAALLPCFWIYHEVGQCIMKCATKNNPYQQWIDLYAGKDFARSVYLAIDSLNFLGNQVDVVLQDKMRSAFKRSALLEQWFWKDAYQLARW